MHEKSDERDSLYAKFPPSEPCSCGVCRAYCARPGWWTVAEARGAMAAGLAARMMAEVSFERGFIVLAPAFKGNEGFFALRELSGSGCTFLGEGRCELFGSGFEPLECRFCHHARAGRGRACHEAVAKDWDSGKGRRLARQWLLAMGLEAPTFRAGELSR